MEPSSSWRPPHCHPHSVWWAVSALPQVYSGLPDHTTHCGLTVHKTLHQVLCVFHLQFLYNFTSSEPFPPSHHRRIQGPELSGAWFLAFCHKCSRAHRVTRHRSESCGFSIVFIITFEVNAGDPGHFSFLVSPDVPTPHPPDEEMSSL